MAVVKQEEDERLKMGSMADPLANAPRAPRAMREKSYARHRDQAGNMFRSMPTTWQHRGPSRGPSASAGVRKNKDWRTNPPSSSNEQSRAAFTQIWADASYHGGGYGPPVFYGLSTQQAYGAYGGPATIGGGRSGPMSMGSLDEATPRATKTFTGGPMVKKEEDGAGGGLGPMSTLNNGSPTRQTDKVVDRTAVVKKEEDAEEKMLVSGYASRSGAADAASPGPMIKVEAAQPAPKVKLFPGVPAIYRSSVVSGRFPGFSVGDSCGDLSDLEIEDPSTGFTYIRCLEDSNTAFGGSLVIAVRGVSAGGSEGGTAGRKGAAYGVFFGPDNPLNQGGRIGDRTNTDRRAELYAAVAGVRAVRELREKKKKKKKEAAGTGHRIEQLVVKTSEEYVVCGIAGGDDGQRPWMENWEENGFVTKQGTEVQNRELWVELAREVRALKRLGVMTQFWEVAEGRVRGASRLAEMDHDTAGGRARGQAFGDFWNAFFPGISPPSMAGCR